MQIIIKHNLVKLASYITVFAARKIPPKLERLPPPIFNGNKVNNHIKETIKTKE